MQIEEAKKHAWFHHHDSDGYIAVAQKTVDGWKQELYKPEKLAEKLSEWLGEDVYFSQNTFYRPQRRIEYIRQLRALYVDVDCYLLNYSPEWVIGSMELNLFKTKIPNPNIIIHSGQGFVMLWKLEPVPHQALPLWQAVQNYLHKQVESFGGDAKALDAARVFRIAGSINSKSGKVVGVEYRHDYRYELRQIQEEYLPALQPRQKEKGRPAKATKLFNTYSLHYARLQDLVKLIELRNYDMRNYRETTCFLYRYWSCCYLQDEQEALANTLELNAAFLEPLSSREVIRATKSAEKAWHARNDKEADRIAKEKGYPGAGYNISNDKLIQWLDITEEEQKHLRSIIGRREKYDRKNTKRQKARREAGAVPRNEYLAQAEKRRQEASKLQEEGLTYRKIAARLGCSLGEVHRLLNGKD